jgi:hypothetical protein
MRVNYPLYAVWSSARARVTLNADRLLLSLLNYGNESASCCTSKLNSQLKNDEWKILRFKG